MAAPYNPPNKNEDFVIFISLQDASDGKSFKAAPTIAAGDFKVSKDGGAFANLTTLPVVTPSGGIMVKVSLSATEMNADNAVMQGIDQTATKEWADFVMSIPTTTA